MPSVRQLRFLAQEKGGFVQDKSTSMCFGQLPQMATLFGDKFLFGNGYGKMGRCRENPVLSVDGNTIALSNEMFSLYPHRASYISTTGSLSDGSIVLVGDFEKPDAPITNDMLKVTVGGSVTSIKPNVDGYIQGVWFLGDLMYLFGDFTQVNSQERNGFAVMNGITGALEAHTWPFTSLEGCSEIKPFGSLKVFAGYSCAYESFKRSTALFWGDLTWC